MGDKKSSLDDTVIFIEANEELYKKSNAEQSRKSRISKTKKEHPLTFISLDALRGSDEDIDNHERYSDSKRNEEYINLLRMLLKMGLITDDEYGKIVEINAEH